MKNLVVYESECFEIVDILSQKLDFENCDCVKFCCYENFNFEQLKTETFEKIFFFASEKLGFVSANFLNFLNEFETRKIDLSLNLIYFFDEKNSSDLVFNWCENLKNLKSAFNLTLSLELSNWKMSAEKLLSLLKNESKQVHKNFDAESEIQSFTGKMFEISNENLKTTLNFESPEKSNQDIKNFVTIYTDGACSGNPGAGGWGAVLIAGERRKEISGFDPLTTNNKMELTAVIKALSMLKQRCNVELYSDSAYVVNAINQNWLENWKKNNFVGSDKKPVKNIELWKALDELLSYHNVHFNKVKGHADNELNNRCDALATGEIATHTQTN